MNASTAAEDPEHFDAGKGRPVREWAVIAEASGVTGRGVSRLRRPIGWATVTGEDAFGGLRSSLEVADRVIAKTGADQWDSPTPCDEWTVGQLAALLGRDPRWHSRAPNS